MPVHLCSTLHVGIELRSGMSRAHTMRGAASRQPVLKQRITQELTLQNAGGERMRPIHLHCFVHTSASRECMGESNVPFLIYTYAVGVQGAGLGVRGFGPWAQ